MPGAKTELERQRDRWNTVAILLPVQWLTLMAAFWIRFLPPLRPFGFVAAPPSASVAAICAAVACLPFFLPDGYFRPRRFERGRLYPRLGVRHFRYLAPDGDLVNRRLRRVDPSYRVVRDRASLREHLANTRSNERWHLAFFLAGAFTVLFAVKIGELVLAALIAALNVVFNLYPVFHQRYKRARARNFARNAEASNFRSTDGQRSRSAQP
ncbi:MAG TPA: hypothetical protein VF590_08535 [Isosphaeraceae bacterium]|jgi:hypothetical protein